MDAAQSTPTAAGTAASDARRRLATFLLLTALLSGDLQLLILTGRVTAIAGQSPILFLMWCPAVAAGLTQLLASRNLRGLGRPPGPPRFLLAGFALPAAYAAVAYVPLWVTGLAGFPESAFIAGAPALVLLASFVHGGTSGVLLSLLTAAGEEIGWRGLLVPQPARLAPSAPPLWPAGRSGPCGTTR